MRGERRALATPSSLLILGALMILAGGNAVALADGVPPPPAVPLAPLPAVGASRLSQADPLNGGYLLVNMHGMLFHTLNSDIQEDAAYARWLGSGIIRVFATDSSGHYTWDGKRIGTRIADIAPILRAAHVRLIVAFVNNHQAVPGEVPASSGWMDGYMQLLLPFYTDNWRGAYLQFVRDLVSTVESRGAQDVVLAWELGNELHTPRQPEALMSFVTDAAAQVRALDPVTPILPGTMGANHVQPGDPHSSIARWLYCDAPVDAYTLHAYDWVSRARPGDMPIDWDLDNITSTPCPNGRSLPVIVEELGTSRALSGVYTVDDEPARLDQEMRQIKFVRQFPQVVGFGVWDGESPRVWDRTFLDVRRGLSSYGLRELGGGSCYDPMPEAGPGARCQLEQALRGVRFLRVAPSSQWAPGADADVIDPVVGLVDPVSSGDSVDSLSMSGWVVDPSTDEPPGVDGVALFLDNSNGGAPLASARLGLPRLDLPPALDTSVDTNVGFSLNVPLVGMPAGPTTLTLMAHTVQHGTWLTTVQVVVPDLGGVAPAQQIVPAASLGPAVPPISVSTPRLEVQSPQPGDLVPRTFNLQVLASGADRVDVFVEPDRDRGGRLVGSAIAGTSVPAAFHPTVSLPPGAHTLYVHALSGSAPREQVLALPVVVN